MEKESKSKTKKGGRKHVCWSIKAILESKVREVGGWQVVNGGFQKSISRLNSKRHPSGRVRSEKQERKTQEERDEKEKNRRRKVYKREERERKDKPGPRREFT